MEMDPNRSDPDEITCDTTTEEITAPGIGISQAVYTVEENETEHRRARGGDFIPRTKLEPALSRIIIVTSFVVLFTGLTLCVLGVVMHGINSYKSRGDEPHIWWTGIVPFFLGMQGIYTGVKGSRTMGLHWGTLSMMTSLTQTAMMGALGDFSLALFDVWPFVDHRAGHPVCVTEGGACTCQDYYHGFYSEVELPGFKYFYTKPGPVIGTDILAAPELNNTGSEIVKWKQTRFKHCYDLYLVSILYYSAMGCYATFVVWSIVSFCLGLAGSICANHKVRFRNLSESETSDVEEEAEGVRPVYQPYMITSHDMDKEMQTIPPWPHDSALAQSSLYSDAFPESSQNRIQDKDIIIHNQNTSDSHSG